MESIKVKDSVEYKGVTYSVGDVIERLDDCPYPIGSKHTIIRINHIYEDCVVAVDDECNEGVHALVYVKKVDKPKEEDLEDIKGFEKHNPELNIGDEVLVLEHPIVRKSSGICYPESMQKYIGTKQKIEAIHEYGYKLSHGYSCEAKYLQKIVEHEISPIKISELKVVKPEIKVGDLVTLISEENTREEWGYHGKMKKVGESFIVTDVYKDTGDGLIEVIDEDGWSYHPDDLLILNRASDRVVLPSVKVGYVTSLHLPDTKEDVVKPVESDGGSSDYYFTKLPQWLIEEIVETGGIEVKDIVQFVFDNDAHAKDIIKAQKRIIEQRKGGGKAGLKPLYDYNKIVFFAEDQLRVAANNLAEKSE